MRIVLDTNVFISALITPRGPADHLYQMWRGGWFQLLTSEDQLDECRRLSRSPRLLPFFQPDLADTMWKEIRLLAHMVHDPPLLLVSPDPDDNFLLGMAKAGKADYLVSGDKHGLLSLERYGSTSILTIRQMSTALS